MCVCEMADGLTAKGRIGQPFKGEKGRYSRDKKIPGPKCDLTHADAYLKTRKQEAAVKTVKGCTTVATISVTYSKERVVFR